MGNKTGMPTFTFLIQCSSGSPSHSSQTRRSKRHPNWKRRSKTVFICKWHDTVHREPQRFHQETTRLINEFSKVTGYKISIQKSVAFLYTNNELSEKETKKTTLFTIASKRIKYLGINLTKDVKELYMENFKTVKKETEEDANKWKHIHCSWIGIIKIIKMFILEKSVDSTQFPSRYQLHISQN